MSRGVNIALGVPTFLPLLYLMALPAAYLLVLGTHGRDGLTVEGAAPGWFRNFSALGFAVQLLTIGLTVFYFVNAFRNRRVEKNLRVMWLILLPLFNMVVIPAYWYLYIWREPPAPHAANTSPGR